jgi:nucleobase:cation symporter-1, NCS1 family
VDHTLEAQPREYGDRVVAVEPGGVEQIPLDERHGSPWTLVWAWASPNFEFATVFVGALGPLFFGLSFAQSASAILVGTLLGSLSHGYLSTMGPRTGVAQMVAARTAFGRRGVVLPATISAFMAGIGWFAVNSASGALALSALTGLPGLLCLAVAVLVQVGVAFLGHNLVQQFQRVVFPVLAVVFVVAAVLVFARSSPSAPSSGGGFGGWMLLFAASWGYAAGWNPYASDYSRYLAPTTSRRAVFGCAFLGVFGACTLLQLAGAAAVTAGAAPFLDNPTSAFTDLLPGPLGSLTLLAIALGAISANVVNVYSGSIAFLATDVPIPTHLRRALAAAAFGLLGFLAAWSALDDAGARYEAFLLVFAYWVAPWLGVVLADRLLRRGDLAVDAILDPAYRNPAGPIAFVVAALVSILLFSSQVEYAGPLASAYPGRGDVTPVVGFVLAAGLYAALARRRLTAG